MLSTSPSADSFAIFPIRGFVYLTILPRFPTCFPGLFLFLRLSIKLTSNKK